MECIVPEYNLVFTGNVSEQAAQRLIQAASQLGFRLNANSVLPETDSILREILALNEEFRRRYASWRLRTDETDIARSIGRLGATVAQLTRQTYAEFLGKQRTEYDRHVGTLLVQLMIDREWSFTDLSPWQTMHNRIPNSGLQTAVRSALISYGLMWLEQLAYFTADGLRDIRLIGRKTIGPIREELRQKGLHLRGER